LRDISAAAERGDVYAQCNLAAMYYNGKGVEQDFAQAFAWLRKAADQGYTEAPFNLGAMYADGEGVVKDITQAVAWLRKAAEQGDADAQEALGKIESSRPIDPKQAW